jgi:starch synthase
MASLLPLYMKKFYNDESIFADTKIITSIYSSGFEGKLSENMFGKIAFDEFNEKDIAGFSDATYANIMKNAIDNSDGIVISSAELPEDLTNYIQSSNKPFLPFDAKENMKDFYPEFYLQKV